MKQLVGVVSILLLSLSSVAVYAGDAEAGKAKSVTCAACHGGQGISPTGTWPNLAGQKEQYLLAQLKAFKEGARVNAQMAPMVANLSEDDMANLAAYYSSLGCK
ncbi:MAG: cytochrome c [Gammaproteobacteria bacterium]